MCQYLCPVSLSEHSTVWTVTRRQNEMWRDNADIGEGGAVGTASFSAEKLKETLWLWRSVGAVRAKMGWGEAEVLGSD